MRSVRFMSVLAVLVTALAIGAVPAQATPIFVNGNFEAGTSTGWDAMTPTNTPGWTVVNGGFQPRLLRLQTCGGPYGANAEGCQVATIGGTETGGTDSIQQTLAGFIVGGSYILSWLQASEYTTSDVINASIIGAATLSQDFTSNPYPGGSQFWYGPWQTMSFAFVADSATLTFNFHSYATNYEPGVDDFQIAQVGGAAVPEPASMLLLGSGLAALVARRRMKARQ
jgi:PEP-CTERM motif-containing protein